MRLLILNRMMTVGASWRGSNALPRLAIAQAILLVACGEDCLSIARRYADEVPNALTCDPAEPDPCSVARPTVVWEQDGSRLTLEGLATCNHSDDASHVAKLDSILADFTSSGCKLLPTPLCPQVQNACIATSPGHYTCAP